MTAWPQKNSNGKSNGVVGGEKTTTTITTTTQNGDESDAAKENKLDLLNDYLRKIQSGEATVEELATKYDNRIKTKENKEVSKETNDGVINGQHKAEGQDENLGEELWRMLVFWLVLCFSIFNFYVDALPVCVRVSFSFFVC